jgi:hypothetical protein
MNRPHTITVTSGPLRRERTIIVERRVKRSPRKQEPAVRPAEEFA